LFYMPFRYEYQSDVKTGQNSVCFNYLSELFFCKGNK